MSCNPRPRDSAEYETSSRLFQKYESFAVSASGIPATSVTARRPNDSIRSLPCVHFTPRCDVAAFATDDGMERNGTVAKPVFRSGRTRSRKIRLDRYAQYRVHGLIEQAPVADDQVLARRTPKQVMHGGAGPQDSSQSPSPLSAKGSYGVRCSGSGNRCSASCRVSWAMWILAKDLARTALMPSCSGARGPCSRLETLAVIAASDDENRRPRLWLWRKPSSHGGQARNWPGRARWSGKAAISHLTA